jgi:hypothetical protein
VTPDPELAKVNGAVLAALASIEAAAGPERAAFAAACMIRVAYILNAVGPQAARQALAATWADLGDDIAGMNGGGGRAH